MPQAVIVCAVGKAFLFWKHPADCLRKPATGSFIAEMGAPCLYGAPIFSFIKRETENERRGDAEWRIFI